MAEVPAPIFGRTLHEEQTTFFRADVFGKDAERITFLGRVCRNMILVRGFVLLGESFSAGTLSVFAGDTALVKDLSLTGRAPTYTDMNISGAHVSNMWNYSCDEYDLSIVRNTANTTTSGRVSIVIEAIDPR
ncbi:MAG: hypothetical protein JSC085_000993 [Candidatus Tokpelaia sp. JSC085]|nr:MAG: hypothetical protein JSC085_000993 [Candidatus Tokpelaia sp. JSC085]